MDDDESTKRAKRRYSVTYRVHGIRNDEGDLMVFRTPPYPGDLAEEAALEILDTVKGAHDVSFEVVEQ